MQRLGPALPFMGLLGGLSLATPRRIELPNAEALAGVPRTTRGRYGSTAHHSRSSSPNMRRQAARGHHISCIAHGAGIEAFGSSILRLRNLPMRHGHQTWPRSALRSVYAALAFQASGQQGALPVSNLPADTHTHTHTHIYIYICSAYTYGRGSAALGLSAPPAKWRACYAGWPAANRRPGPSQTYQHIYTRMQCTYTYGRSSAALGLSTPPAKWRARQARGTAPNRAPGPSKLPNIYM